MADPTLPFFDDPPAPASGGRVPGSRERPFSVSEVNSTARDLLEQAFPEVWLQGEISNFKAHSSGHHYFSLKDARSQINAVMFRGANATLKFRPGDGLSVLVRGRLTLYEPRGAYQINVAWMEPLGAGSLQLAFEQLKAKLKAEGLFDAERKRPIPILPRRVGIVTSPTGAAIRDVLHVLERRAAGLSILIAPCRVQGAGAAAEIVEAIDLLNRMSSTRTGGPIDALIVGRGGGSLEDLWAFNEESVARAIAASGIPVISAVGHETDVTIADFVADLRAPTPSAAAEMVIRSREELASRVSSAATRLGQAARYRVLSLRGRVEGLARSRAFSRVESHLAEAQQRRDEAFMRLGNAMLDRVRDARERLSVARERLSPRSLKAEVAARRGRLSSAAEILHRAAAGRVRALREILDGRAALLKSLSPLAVLDRGYAICQDAGGRVISAAAKVKTGDDVMVRLARGSLGARVLWTKERG